MRIRNVQQSTLIIRQVLLLLISILLIQSTNSLRVAVLGSGIAGSTAARTLADRGVEVTVFEAGFGIGGRTSTRITRDKGRYQFDHGAQYIGSPKSIVFRDTLQQWIADGWVTEWDGRFVTVNGREVIEDKKKDRFVGYPGMHSICRNLLHHENIRVKLQTRALASNTNNGETDEWELIHGKSKKNLGNFDWLIVSDRNSAGRNRNDLRSAANVNAFQSNVHGIKSVKSLTAMVVFEKPLNLNINAAQFSGKDDDLYGSLGWIARDSSKPGRQRDDGQECWVLQSHPEAAKNLLKGKYKVNEIREMAKDVLVRDFLKSIPYLTGVVDEQKVEYPPITTAIGHRWGAAFPIPSEKFIEEECQVIPSQNFAACGDYFGTLSGRIEGAYLSGRSAANDIISFC